MIEKKQKSYEFFFINRPEVSPFKLELHMINSKKRDRTTGEQVSPPPKMSKNQADGNPSNAELMAQLNKLISANTDMIQKIDQLEKRFGLVEKLVDEVETLKKEVNRLKQPHDGFRRFEIEQKKKSLLLKGLRSLTSKKYESRQETYDRINELFMHIGLNLTLEDYQRLGPIKPDDPGSTLVRLQFWTKDDKSQIFSKFKEFSNDSVIKSISLINDYPLFQLAEVKKLSDQAYKIRREDRSVKTRIVPAGLELRLQTRRGATGKWMMVSSGNQPIVNES